MLNDCQNYKIGRLEVKGKVFSITHLDDDRNALVISYKKDGKIHARSILFEKRRKKDD